MDTVTYQNEDVVSIINEYTQPLKVPHTAKLEILDSEVNWTPALFMINPEGKRIQDNTGFLPPEEMIAWIILGCGKMQFMQDSMDHAIQLLNIILKDHPESHWAPEALFFSSVANFNTTDDPSALIEGYSQLKKQYPDSIWAKKALPYRLL